VALAAFLIAGASAAAVGATAESAGAQQQAAATRLAARLTPSGDPNGSGAATFRLSKAQRRVCATVEWHSIGTPKAAHIHRSDGQVVVDLTGSVTGGRHCASNVSRALIGRILAHPGRYYFNVHNATYPAGAIQGRLHR
jgi:hypothetical protein